jgi:hypothetical protein
MMTDLPPYHFQHAVSAASAATVEQATAAEPPTQCEIRLPRWCISIFDGRIETTNSRRYRIWALQSRLYMKHGPLLIVEDKACSARDDTTPPRELPRRTLRGDDGKEYVSATYVIGGEENCRLEFRMPVRGYYADPTYEQVMRLEILICAGEDCNLNLDKFSKP